MPSCVATARAVVSLSPVRVGNADKPGYRAINGDEHDGLACAAQFLGTLAQAARRNVVMLQHGEVAKHDRSAIDASLDAHAGQRFELLDVARPRAALDGPCDDGVSQRMLAAFLQRRR